MKQPKTFLLLGVIVAVLILGVAYASITSVDLEISGNVISTPEQSNFKVKFDGSPVVTGKGTAATEITGDRTAYLNVRDLKALNDTLTATFTIINPSDDIAATIADAVSNSNPEYFEVTSSLSTLDLPAVTGTATLTVNVKLIKTPVQADVESDIGVTVTASPVHR